MTRSVIHRTEMFDARLDLGGQPIELSEYATTGLVALAVAPRGQGKTNAGLLIGEQLAEQGWLSLFIDAEDELESLYGKAVADPDELRLRLALRDQSIVVVAAKDAGEFVPYGQAILDAAEEHRKPLFVFIDEGQLFSAAKKRQESIGAAADIISQFAERGRKRALDLFVTTHRYTGTLHRTLFSNANLTLVGCQQDPTVWSALAPQFRATGIEFKDLNALMPGEFMCLARRGIEKVRLPMAAALQAVAPKAQVVRRTLPATFSQWDRAMRAIPTERLLALTDPVVELLGAIAGLTPPQMLAGARALGDELEIRG